MHPPEKSIGRAVLIHGLEQFTDGQLHTILLPYDLRGGSCLLSYQVIREALLDCHCELFGCQS